MQRPPPAAPCSSLPPDGGWGWVIVIASGIASGFPAGFHRSVTLFYHELLKVFRQSATSTATVMSVDTVVGALTSPLAGALCNRFGCGLMAMVGGAFIALAFLTSAFVPTLFYFYFTYSILRGFGSTVFAVARISVVNLHFDRNKGKANAISAMFYSLGSVYMAPLMTFLFSEYGLRGALIICSALMLHVIPAAALFRPLPELEAKPKVGCPAEGIGSQGKAKESQLELQVVPPGKCQGEELGPEGNVIKSSHEIEPGSQEKYPIEELTPKVEITKSLHVDKDCLKYDICRGERPPEGESLQSGVKDEQEMESKEGSGSIKGAAPLRQKTELSPISLPTEGLDDHTGDLQTDGIVNNTIDKRSDCNTDKAIEVGKVDMVSQRKLLNTSEEENNCQRTGISDLQPQAAVNVKQSDTGITDAEITLLPPFPNTPDDTAGSPLSIHNADMSNEHCGTPVTAQCFVRQRSVQEQHPDPETIKHRVSALTYINNATRVFTGGVLQDSNFLLYCLFMCSYAYTHAMTFTFLSGLALQKGCTIAQCTFTLAVMSGVEIPLRLSYGFGFDLKVVRERRQLVFGVCGCMIGLLVVMSPLFSGCVTVLVIWAVQQAIAGVIVCQWSTVMSDILPCPQLTSGFGVLRFFMGIGGLLAPISGGAMRDGSGSYSLVYYVAGTQMFVVSVVFLIHDVRRRILDGTQEHTASA